jgi:tetratricopeptide (TPR) repeat protein
VHLYDPHLPYVPPEPFASRFAGRPYDGEIAFMDAEIGRLVDALKRRTGSIVIAVAGDHGESLGEHGEEGHGVFLYQATQRVPMILAGPGIPMGKTVATTVGLIDLAPTLLELVGQGPLPGADGRSLVSHLDGARFAAADYELETFYPAYAYGWSPLRALVSGPLKYIEAPRKELYELPTDPRETHDLAKVPARAARLREMDGELKRHVASDSPSPSLDAETEERRNRLASLGYVGGSQPSSSSAAAAIDPKDGIAMLAELDQAKQWLREGRATEAVARLEDLVRRSPGNVPFLVRLAVAQAAAGRASAGLATLKHAVGLNPRLEFLHAHLADAYLEQGRLREARAEYEVALELNPRFARAWLGLGEAAARTGEPGAELKVMRRAVAAGTDSAIIWTRLAELELAAGDTAAAARGAEEATRLVPELPQAWLVRGTVAEKTGRVADAVRLYERAMSLGLADPQLRERVERLRRGQASRP